MALLVGVDAGGTASRAVVTTLTGEVVGRSTAGPGNPSAHGVSAAIHIGAAIREAIHCRGEVAAAVVGIAGISGLADPAVAEAFDREWTAIGLSGKVHVVGDAVTAFAAGTDHRTGTVLIAGTGAVAALIDDTEIVQTADGLGWLLGDEGSGLWLGLQAVRSAARRFDSRLGASIAAHAGVTSADELVRWAGRVPPSAFAALAPLVCASTDPVAEQLTAEASARLVRTLGELDEHPGPVVLAGGLLAADTPVRSGVLTVLRARGADVHIAGDPAVGAAKLALRTWRNPQACPSAKRYEPRQRPPGRGSTQPSPSSPPCGPSR